MVDNKELDPMTRHQVYAVAYQHVTDRGPIGEAWMYVLELTAPANAEMSLAWIKTQLNRAANDENIHPTKRSIYSDVSTMLM